VAQAECGMAAAAPPPPAGQSSPQNGLPRPSPRSGTLGRYRRPPGFRPPPARCSPLRRAGRVPSQCTRLGRGRPGPGPLSARLTPGGRPAATSTVARRRPGPAARTPRRWPLGQVRAVDDQQHAYAMSVRRRGAERDLRLGGPLNRARSTIATASKVAAILKSISQTVLRPVQLVLCV
jgi:hypothetical protein